MVRSVATCQRAQRAHERAGGSSLRGTCAPAPPHACAAWICARLGQRAGRRAARDAPSGTRCTPRPPTPPRSSPRRARAGRPPRPRHCRGALRSESGRVGSSLASRPLRDTERHLPYPARLSGLSGSSRRSACSQARETPRPPARLLVRASTGGTARRETLYPLGTFPSEAETGVLGASCNEGPEATTITCTVSMGT